MAPLTSAGLCRDQRFYTQIDPFNTNNLTLKKANANYYVSRICFDVTENTLHQPIQQNSIQAMFIPILAAAKRLKPVPLHLRLLEIRLFTNK